MTLAVGRRLGHYEIAGSLGAGGMGEVYRAKDTKLGRDVALKVLPAETAREPERLARFQREARAVAALNHPNIVTLHSVEEADGVHFLTMEVVEGQPLDQVIPEGGVDLDRLIVIGTALAEALGAAHERGITHRDLKPANVMITHDGRVKVLDFGLAKATEPPGAGAAAVTAAGVTEAGLVMGTPAYMSPEQVSGRALDHRTDIFSLGVLLYEIATGRKPFGSDSTAGLMAAILRDPPPSAGSIRRELPAALQQVIERCLRKDPAARFQTAREVRSSLADALGSRSAGAIAAAVEQSIAVLPFASLSASPDDAFFADGVTEEILNALAQIPGLRVAGRSSAFSFKGRYEDVREVGTKLNVATVLEGTLRRAGNRLRITAQLTNAASGYQIWSERYDRVVEDVFAVQDEIASTIAGRLRLSLTSDPGGAPAKPPTRHLGAYELYLKGRTLLYRRGLSILEAISCFQEAVSLDPGYAQAWAGLADGYTTSGYSGFKAAADVMPQALEAARRAIELDPELADAHNALACATLLYERNYSLAERGFRRALELNPSYPQALAWYGLFYLHWAAGRHDEGRNELARLLELDPLSGYAHTIFAMSAFTTGRTAEAVVHARRGIELAPNSFLAHWCLSISCYFDGQHDEGIAAGERAAAMSGNHVWSLSQLALFYAASGQSEQARATFREIEARSVREYVQPSMLAQVAAAVGESDRAIAFARRALDEHDPFFVMVARSYPGYAQLRRDPRFLDIVAEMNYPNWTRPD
ncbi:MAG: protein kinase domain-containing protein [Acidobacteriota bacterium]